jgi:Zn-dependent peptidase ImmA (M78 family)
MHSDMHYRTLAAEAVRRASITEPPVPVEGLAADLGVPVRAVHLPAFFSGAIISEDGMPVLLLNSVLEESTRRQTLAHLLGHVLIVLADPAETYPRNSDPTHREADAAASELLLPEYLVRDQARKWFNDHRYLAGLFGVNESEMMNRMRELGIIKAREVLWDY